MATSGERDAAGLTAKRLDLLSMPMLAIANQRVNVCLGVSKVGTIAVRTGEALGIYAFGSSPATFLL
jgi:hypothetical protein